MSGVSIVCVNQYESQGNFGGTLRYRSLGSNSDTVDVLKCEGEVLDTLHSTRNPDIKRL